MPEGPSRTAYYNLEACNTIIRALPPISSSNVNNLYNQTSARLGRAATFAELSKAMNLYRVSIDNDIKTNGAAAQYRNNKRMPEINFKSRSTMPRNRFTSFNLDASQEESNPDAFMQMQPGESYGAYNNNVSYTPRPIRDVRTFSKFANQNRNQNQRPDNGQKMGNEQTRKWDPRRKNNSQNQSSNYVPINSCSACGLRGHKIQDCKNIVSDSGKLIELLPTQGTCNKCPERVQPRLHHPEFLCPYRPGAPLHKKQTN
jgi:hypothetical protein